jgi:muconate cycloisomerase
MKITKIETIPLRIPFHDPFTIASQTTEKRNSIDVLIVKIHTDEGLYGLGETQAWRRQGSGEIIENLVFMIHAFFEPLMIGRSPLEMNAIMDACDTAVYHNLYAQAAIGDALYDLIGKMLNVPVYELLGGKCRDAIKVGICVPIFKEPSVTLEKAQKFYEKGYRYIRIKIGIDPNEDVANVNTFRQHFGSDVVLRADANAGLSYPDALRLLKKLEPFDLDMVEQLIPLWDLTGMADLARHTSIPLSVDESVSTTNSLMEVIKYRAASIVQTKTGKNGGIYYSRKLWDIAYAAGMSIFPGNHPTTSIGCAAVTHLAASWPGPLMVGDYQNALDGVLVSDIVLDPLHIEDGQIAIPQGPGLGMELDMDKIRFYRIDI